MKHFYVTLIALFITCTTFGNTIRAVASGYWESSSTWTPVRLPQDNDTIVIPAGITVTIDVNNPYNKVSIRIYGTLSFDNGKLRLDNNSEVIIESGGKITGINSNDQLTIGSTLKYSGNDRTVTGPAVANSSTGTDPNGFMSVLPVTFQSFYTVRQNADVCLNFSTSAEIYNSFFVIEKSTDAFNWKQVAVITGAGSTASTNKYSYTDKDVTAATVYYRVRQTDINGAYQYSAIRTVFGNGVATVTNIYASSKQTITVDFNSDVKDNVTIQVVNMNGQIISRCNYKMASYRLTLHMPACNGLYVVKVSDATGWSEAKKVVL